MKLVEHKDLTEHLTPYFKCMLAAVRESKLPLQMKGVSMARLEAYEEDLAVRFDAVKQRHFAWGMFSAQNLFSNDALLNGALNGENLCQDQLEEVCSCSSCSSCLLVPSFMCLRAHFHMPSCPPSRWPAPSMPYTCTGGNSTRCPSGCSAARALQNACCECLCLKPRHRHRERRPL
jgi:hypothetical protein